MQWPFSFEATRAQWRLVLPGAGDFCSGVTRGLARSDSVRLIRRNRTARAVPLPNVGGIGRNPEANHRRLIDLRLCDDGVKSTRCKAHDARRIWWCCQETNRAANCALCPLESPDHSADAR